MVEHVLVISLGPVQDFIATARRCRDLWFGSWVLSELAKAVAAGVAEGIGGEAGRSALVFPAPEDPHALDPGSEVSVANKIVALVPGGAERVRKVAEAGRARMMDRVRRLSDRAFERIAGEHFDRARAGLQVEDAFELVWAAAPVGEGGYPAAREEADRLLAARKNARAWSQPAWAREGVRKCSLDGVRDSVIDEAVYGSHAVVGPEVRRRRYGVRDGERLCGVGVLKRWGTMEGGQDRFFSTPHLAARPLMLAVAGEEALRGPFEALRAAIGEAAGEMVAPVRTGIFGDADGGMLFAGRVKEVLRDRGRSQDDPVVKGALEKLRDFLRAAGRGDPLPYYAILVADGDGMGARIKALASAEDHRRFSQRLARFAGDARGIVEESAGSLVYSGGDDVLALLPLHRAIECASALATRFRAVTEGATLSAGMAVVHYVDPLGAAIDLARAAEREAKQVDGKDALAVALDKRSGETTRVKGRWEDLARRLIDLTDLHLADAIPDKAGYELAALARLGGLREIQRSEALRILRRKRAKHGKEAMAEEKLQALVARLGDDPAELGAELAVAAILARAKKQAAPGEGRS